MRITIISALVMCLSFPLFAEEIDPYQPDGTTPRAIEGMKLVWNDEFEGSTLNTSNWVYEKGFVRNQELQYYQPSNVTLSNGLLVFTAKRETVLNTSYVPESSDWRYKTQYADYSSGSIKSQKKKSFLFGHFEIRARIDTTKGSWPAIWTKGNDGQWPTCGEIDILEFYISGGKQVFLSNVIYGSSTSTVKYMGAKKDLSYFLAKDPDFVKKFHVWTEIWDENKISLYLDDELIYARGINVSANPSGTGIVNGFLQPHYFTLNLAIGANGGDPSKSIFPITYEVDYVRVYQKEVSAHNALNENEKIFFSHTDNSLHVQTDEPCARLVVMDLMGRKMLNIEHPESKISLQMLQTGIYLTKVDFYSGKSMTYKIRKFESP